MRRFRSRRFAMLLILMLTLSMAIQGVAPVAFAEEGDQAFDQSRIPQEDIPSDEGQDGTMEALATPASMTIETSVVPSEAWPGDIVHYTFKVTNTGSKYLYGVDVDDSLEPGGPSDLKDIPTNQFREFHHDYRIPDGTRGVVVNDGWADGWYKHNGWKEVQSNHDSVNVTVKWPGISLAKLVDKADAFPGENVKYTFRVTNTGTVPLYDITLQDSDVGYNPSPLGMLAAGASHDFEYSYMIPCPVAPRGDAVALTMPSFINNAMVTGYLENQPNPAEMGILCERPPKSVSAKASATVSLKEESLGLMLSKHVEADSEMIPSTVTALNTSGPIVGERCLLVNGDQESVFYFFDLYNSGNAPLHDVVIHDPMLGEIPVIGEIPVGGSKEVGPIEYSLAEVTEWPLINIATASASGFCKAVESNEDSACVNLAKISIDKTVAPESITLGAEVIYTLKITNEGNTTLYDIEVNDSNIAYTTTIPMLAPQAVATIAVPYTIQAGDIVGGLFVNTASVTANTCAKDMQGDNEIYFFQCMQVGDSDDAVVTVTIPTTTTTTTTTTTPGGERDRAEPAVTITEAPVPLAAPVVIPAPVVAPVIEDEVIPLGVPVLPKTAELPIELFYGLGGMLTAIGAFLKRK